MADPTAMRYAQSIGPSRALPGLLTGNGQMDAARRHKTCGRTSTSQVFEQSLLAEILGKHFAKTMGADLHTPFGTDSPAAADTQQTASLCTLSKDKKVAIFEIAQTGRQAPIPA